MKELHRLTDLQIALLDSLWRRGEATVREVYEDQRDTLALALKTVGTVLRRLEEQGILDHREESRQFVYRSRVTRDEVRAAVLRAAVDSLFDGSAAGLVIHALSVGELRPDDVAAIRDRLDRLAG